MIEILLCVILTPFAAVAAIATVGLAIGTVKAIGANIRSK